MTLQQQILEDLKAAMRAGDVERREALRMLRAAILNEEIERQHTLSDSEVLAVIERLIKRHQDSIEQFRQGNRPDLVAREEAQMAAIRAYLPERLTREEIEARVRAAIAETGARGRGDVGKVMQRLAPELRGRADLKEVNRVVQDLLGA